MERIAILEASDRFAVEEARLALVEVCDQILEDWGDSARDRLLSALPPGSHIVDVESIPILAKYRFLVCGDALPLVPRGSPIPYITIWG